MTKVKICGITNLEDALVACEAGADALGFVLAPEAKKKNRYIERDAALRIIEKLPPFITTVAVTVNEAMMDLAGHLTCFDCVQLHGEEEPEDCPPAHVTIKAFRPGPGFGISDLDRYQVRAYLLDAYSTQGRGGLGETGDWEFAKMAVGMRKPIILAGGLTPENVAEAVGTVRPYAVDTSSGVESAPGKKDHDRIRAFIHNAKASLA